MELSVCWGPLTIIQLPGLLSLLGAYPYPTCYLWVNVALQGSPSLACAMRTREPRRCSWFAPSDRCSAAKAASSPSLSGQQRSWRTSGHHRTQGSSCKWCWASREGRSSHTRTPEKRLGLRLPSPWPEWIGSVALGNAPFSGYSNVERRYKKG